MNQIFRFCLVLPIAWAMSSCVAYVDPAPVVGGWEGSAATVVVGGATAGMVGYPGGYYGGSYYRRPYGAGYYGRSYARGYHRPYVGARPGRF